MVKFSISKINMLQFKIAQTAVQNYFNLISAGKLTQQWIVVSYLRVETNDLNFTRQHQIKLRVE